MNNEQYYELHKKYSELLPEENIIDCGKGLYEIIDEMLAAIKIYQDANLGTSSLIPTVFNLLEIKYGCLSITYSGGDDIVRRIVDFTEKISYKTCEICGKIGELYCSSKWMKWSDKKTLCNEHAARMLYYTLT
tara:strand:+ start:389 stop:787 length:399 start_codon:yes stop_codon:yes gene_type:complete